MTPEGHAGGDGTTAIPPDTDADPWIPVRVLALIQAGTFLAAGPLALLGRAGAAVIALDASATTALLALLAFLVALVGTGRGDAP